MKPWMALLAGMTIGGGAVWVYERPEGPVKAAAVAPVARQAAEVAAAAQGRVEGRTESVSVEAGADGVIQAIRVEEGQRVRAGDVIAVLACENLDAEIRALQSTHEAAVQARTRLLRGAREEERRVADEEVAGARAVVEQARKNNERMQYLAAKDAVARNIADQAVRDLATAEAALRAALERQKLVNAGPLPEEVAKADAEASAAAERLEATVERRDKCVVRAPLSGSITRIHMRAGETFSTMAPRPIVTMADLSERRIRAEVDERDVPKVARGQRVRMTVPGRPDAFGGKVVWTNLAMGRKTVRSTDPSEKSDHDILETLIAPDADAPPLPVGLRVVVEFLAESSTVR